MLDVKIGRRYRYYGAFGKVVFSVIVNGISTDAETMKEYVVYTRENNGIMQHISYDKFIKQTFTDQEVPLLVNSFVLVDRVKSGDIMLSKDGIQLKALFTDNDGDRISVQPICKFHFNVVLTKFDFWNRKFDVQKYIKDEKFNTHIPLKADDDYFMAFIKKNKEIYNGQ